MKPVLIIQNDAREGAGRLGGMLVERGVDTMNWLGWEADYDRLDCIDYAGLVVLGGAQSVYETDQYPYLVSEIGLIKAFIAADKPVIGLCLGGQLIAAALGGRVYPGAQKELGWFDIYLSDAAEDDPVMGGQPQIASAYHFHGDCFDTPPGCVKLASSELTGSQLFRYGDRVYGFQFHPEVDQALVEIMCRNNVDYMAANGYDADAVIEESALLLPGYEDRTRPMFTAWMDLLGQEGRGGAL